MQPSFLYLFTDVFVKGLQFFLMPIASHILDVETYGSFVLCLVLLTSLVPLISLSSESSYSIFYNQSHDDDKNRLFVNSIHVAFTGYLLFTLVTLILSIINDNLLFEMISLKSHITKMCAIVFFEYFINITLLSYRLSFKKIAYVKVYLGYFFIKFISAIISIYLFKSINHYLNTILALNFIISVAIVSKQFGLVVFFKELKIFDTAKYLKITKYCIVILPVSVFAIINAMVDKIYITSLLSMQDLANYSSIFLIAGSIQIIILAMNKSYMPKLLYHYAAEGYSAIHRMKEETVKLMLINFTVFIICILLLPIMFRLVFDSNIEFNYAVFIVLSLSFLSNTLYILFTNILSLEEKTGKYKMFGFVSALIINIPLGYLLTLEYGVLGSAFSTMLSGLSAAIILFAFVSCKVLKAYLLRESCYFLFGAIAVSASAVYINNHYHIY
ncbi:Putative lipopolysaccharide biosynthesis protein [Pseudoalteromonas issachenkonii]|nr:hypothetical protein [Pseudoalteromonas issachenkonii]ALQ53802.1 Putative lipopolysaccharide biosynthesis protein [Pseudoalteromonas issachenkonii]